MGGHGFRPPKLQSLHLLESLVESAGALLIDLELIPFAAMSTHIVQIQTLLKDCGKSTFSDYSLALPLLHWDPYAREHGSAIPLDGFVSVVYAGRNLIRLRQRLDLPVGSKHVRRHQSALNIAASDILSLTGRGGSHFDAVSIKLNQFVTVRRWMCLPFYPQAMEAEVDVDSFSIALPPGSAERFVELLQSWQRACAEGPVDSDQSFRSNPPPLNDPGELS